MTAPAGTFVDGPRWYEIAQSYLGLREYTPQRPGPNGEQSNEQIEKWQRAAGIRRPDDATPWCAAAMTGWLYEAGLTDFATSAARSFGGYGRGLAQPRLGCIVVLWREAPSSPHGHVGLFVREDERGLWLLGGNEDNAVTIKPYPRLRLVKDGFRWPTLGQLTAAHLDENGRRVVA